MRFWLTSFVLIFSAIELFDWVMQRGSWHPTGIWLILGGMGLAAISNVSSARSPQVANSPDLADHSNAVAQAADQVAEQALATSQSALPNSLAQAHESHWQAQPRPSLSQDKDSISFKVRPLKR